MRTLLVANRGEIAVRIMRTARALGLRTVAVYSDADVDAPHVRAADVAVRLGPAPAASSYLDVGAVLAAAAQTGADAVHPGYGFLSERAALAPEVEKAGLTWVGPSPEVIDRLGRKDVARRVAQEAGVPVLPAEVLDDAPAEEVARRIGFPLLVKAAAGGGGKGMRVVRAPADLADAVAAAGREALNAFGDAALVLERFVERGRHLEVQVLGDRHGTLLHLGERDCSVQRRHQKVIEEAPAPGLSNAVREKLTGHALAIARQVGYVNAGTVEFLLDVAGDEIFFLEMNTRLQVEHAVTELVTGLDLVALQLRVARGEPIGLTQGDIRVRGHAIEARVYAENPARGFLPQAGRAERVRWPVGVRVDEALADGQEVGPWYDPMLGKVIAHGPDRESARAALAEALSRTEILGLTTNVTFLHRLLATEAFADHAVDTAWLDRESAAVARLAAAVPDPVVPEPVVPGAGPFGVLDGWRLGGPSAPLRPLGAGAGAAEEVTALGDGRVEAPMPGAVLAVHVRDGDLVTAGQPLGVVEAMKMEHTLTAPDPGRVQVFTRVAAQVSLGECLFHIHPDDGGQVIHSSVEEPVDGAS